jgi:hypothetical protein
MTEEISTIPNLSDVSVTEIQDDEYQFLNNSIYHIGQYEEFFLWAAENVSNVNCIVKGKNRRKKSVIRSQYTGPKPLIGRDRICELIEDSIKQCNTAREAEAFDGYDHINNIRDRNSRRPKVMADHLISVVMANEDFYQEVGSDFITFSNVQYKGVPTVNFRTLTTNGAEAVHDKLFQLKRDKKENFSKLIWQFDKYFYNLNACYKFSNVNFSIPQKKQIYRYESKKKASAGFIELEPFSSNSDLRSRLIDLSDEFISFTTNMSPKKNQSAGLIVLRLFDALEEIEEIIRDGNIPAEGYFGAVRYVIKRKPEFGIITDFIDFMSSSSKKEVESISKFISKQRIFWSASQMLVLIDRLISTPGINKVKAGSCTQICAIGCDVVGGSFSNLVRRLNLSKGDVESELFEILDSIYEERPHLRHRTYIELDFSKYDSLVSSLMIMVSLTYMNLDPYNVTDDEILENVKNYISDFSVTNNTYKYAFVPFLRVMYLFAGRVPSGSLSTSSLDSVAQIVLRYMHIDEVIEEKFLSEEYELAYELMLVKEYLLVALVYGDDRTESLPTVLYEHVGAHSFGKWLSSSFDWIIKFIIPDIDHGQPLDYYKNSIGEIYFQKIGSFYKMMSFVDSPTFLKTKVARVFVDGNYITTMSYRFTYDIVSKISNSLTAYKHPVTICCALASLAWISGGNLEAYSIVRRVYLRFTHVLGISMSIIRKEMNDFTRECQKDQSLISKYPHSMRTTLVQGLGASFPSWSQIAKRHNINSTLKRKNTYTFQMELDDESTLSLNKNFRPLRHMFTSYSRLKEYYQRVNNK